MAAIYLSFMSILFGKYVLECKSDPPLSLVQHVNHGGEAEESHTAECRLYPTLSHVYTYFPGHHKDPVHTTTTLCLTGLSWGFKQLSKKVPTITPVLIQFQVFKELNKANLQYKMLPLKVIHHILISATKRQRERL